MFSNYNFNNPLDVEKFICRKFVDKPDRLSHILNVAAMVKDSAKILLKKYGERILNLNTAVLAALLHDIGYVEEFKPQVFILWMDKRLLNYIGCSHIAKIIVGHSSAPEEAELRGLKKNYN